MINQLEKLEKQDVNYKSKIMKQNKEDLLKADVVKEQRKIQEAILSQRMILQNNISRVNQFPQSDCFSAFEDSKIDELSSLKNSLKKNISTLNDISILLGKRINVNLSPINSEDSNIFTKIDKNYEKLLPT